MTVESNDITDEQIMPEVKLIVDMYDDGEEDRYSSGDENKEPEHD